MSAQQEPSAQLPTSYEDIVVDISRFTGQPRAEVERRVWAEALEPGWNVMQDASRFGVTPFQYDDCMTRLYTEGDGFIFDSLVFWARRARQLWIQHAFDRIRRHAERTGTPLTSLRVLMFGDGPGSDSLFLASRGVTVEYHEVPGSRTYEFAVRRFQHYGFWKRLIKPFDEKLSSLQGAHDVVLCFEVLEHLPDPLAAIEQIGAMLKIGGLAIITDDFGDLTAHLPTHLRSSARYQGATPFLFLRNSMVLTWYSRDELFKPYEFVNLESVSAKTRVALLRDPHVRGLYLAKYANRAARFISKLPYFRLSR